MSISIVFEILDKHVSIIFFLGNLPAVVSTHASALTYLSSTFCRVSFCSRAKYYYQAIRMNVSKSGSYVVFSNSSIDTYGFIYNNHFNASSPTENLLMLNDDGPYGNQIQMIISLETTVDYILVVTTYRASMEGIFSVTGRGLGSVRFVDAQPNSI
jgi:hypothetical protein